MACNIGGATVHGWGRVAFKDKRGMRILPQDTKDINELPGMTVKDIVFDFLVMVFNSGPLSGIRGYWYMLVYFIIIRGNYVDILHFHSKEIIK